MFVGSNKIVDSIITLQFDKFLQPKPACTIIYLGSVVEPGRCWRNPIDILDLYRQHGIDTSTFSVVHDIDLLNQYGQFGLYGTFNFWIRQQLIKFMAVDSCGAAQILIQDSDILLTKPYFYFVNGTPVPFIFPNTSHSPGYYEFVKKFTGQSRQTNGCFVTDFMPLRHTDWTGLKQYVEQTYAQDWLSAIISVFKQEPGDIMFSEYEVLGNWLMLTNPDLRTVEQHNYLLQDPQAQMIKDKNFNDSEYDPNYYNAVAIKLYNTAPKLDFIDIEYCKQIFMRD
jgi:hypothetical protein